MLYYFMFINMKKVLLFFITLLAIFWVLFIGLLATWYISTDWLLWKYINNGLTTTTTEIINISPSPKITNKLSWTYKTNNWEYIIDFYNDWTLRWREVYEVPTMTFADGTTLPENKYHESFYEWTYEYSNWEYILFVKWWDFAVNTVFHARPQQDGSLLINGWTVYNQYFRKTK